MKAKIIKEILDFKVGGIIEILNIDTVDDGVNIHFLNNNKYYKCYFDDAYEVNEYLEFNYEEVKSTDYIYIREDEVKNRLNELETRKQEEIDYWKNKLMKLIDKI